MKDVSEYHFFWPGYSVWSDGRNHPISAQDLSRLHQFGPKALPRCLFGYVLYAGIWKGDILVADIEELEGWPSTSLRNSSCLRRSMWMTAGHVSDEFFDDDELPSRVRAGFRPRIMCRGFLAGHCRYGWGCTFAHHVSELHTLTPDPGV